jgi:hypothetical protein
MSKTDAAPKRKKSSLSLIGILCIGGFFPPTAIVLLAGMIPTYIAWLTDRTKGKLTGITVAAANLATLMPILLRLWDKGNTFNIALSTLASPFSWIVILAGSGVGWMLAQVFPLMVVGVISARDKAKLDKARARQKVLVDEWGPGITEVNQPRRLH